jgi:NAD(P)-dependent dehydrogenase (short-subunit alcohol dehydrogenase family)
MTAKELTAQRVWMITGTSRGFGHEFVRAALERGDLVIATSRDPQKVTAAFPQSAPRLLAVPMNPRDAGRISMPAQAPCCMPTDSTSA